MAQQSPNALDALNQTFDQLPARTKVAALVTGLAGIPILCCVGLGASFEDESAQLLWLVWVLWLLVPRVWYCHTRGKSPWRGQ